MASYEPTQHLHLLSPPVSRSLRKRLRDHFRRERHALPDGYWKYVTSRMPSPEVTEAEYVEAFHNRFGGSGKQPASAATKGRGATTPATAITARISSYSPPGAAWEEWAFPQAPAHANRPGAPISSGNVTAALGGSGAPPGYVA